MNMLELAYAGQFLQQYETRRYPYFVRQTLITVPAEAEQFADVSFYQRGLDWTMYAAHARAVILRLGQNTWKDTAFEEHYAGARAHGLALGGYYFFDGRASPQQQAAVIVAAMQGKHLDLELFVDWEHNYGGAWEGVANAVKLMQLVEAAGVRCHGVGMYTGYYWFSNNTDPVKHAAEFNYLKARPLWLAWYAAPAYVKIPPPWEVWTHWQSGTPVVDWGQPTAEIDMNNHNGSRVQFAAKYLGGGEPPPSSGGTVKTYKILQPLNMRGGPSTNYPILSTFPTGTLVQGILDPATNWVHLGLWQKPDGTEGVLDAWCSGLSAYVAEVPGGGVGKPQIEIVYDPNAADVTLKPQ